MRKLLWISLAVLAMGVTTAGCTVDDTYGFCNSTADCNDLDDECLYVEVYDDAGFPVSAGNFCSHGCFDDFDCESAFGFAGACYNVDRTEPLCYQTCFDNLDCYSSSVCRELAVRGGAIDFVCLPDN